VTLLDFLPALAVLALILGLVRASLMFRARTMRALAARSGLRYIGPAALRWWGFPKTKLPVPIPFSLAWWPANKIRQIWNVIEGEHEGVPVLIFDSLLVGVGKSGVYRTFFACKAEESPFGTDVSPDRVVHSHGWTVLYRVPRFLEAPWATWTMGIHRIEDYLNRLRVGSGARA
jgi:hypothetical protein